MFAMQCTIVDPSNLKDQTQVRPVCVEMYSTLRLIGTVIVSSYQAVDEHGVTGTFSVFPDLSCRTPSCYRLCFKLLRIDIHNMRQGAVHSFVASTVINAFEVYTAREFPGMKPSSALLKVLRQQGMNVSVKKGSKSHGASAKRERTTARQSQTAVVLWQTNSAAANSHCFAKTQAEVSLE